MLHVSGEACSLDALKITNMVVKHQSDCIMLYCILVFSESSGSIFQNKKSMLSKKRSDYLREDGIKNISYFSLLAKLRDDNR